MDKSALLQKQIKENSEVLQKEFIDMEVWEEQMKKKDMEIRNSNNDQTIPAVRSKIKKKCVPTPEISKDEKPKKTKRTGISDYNAWNKFDADKACKEIDGNVKLEKSEKIYEIVSEEELEKEHAQALQFKNEGNLLVKEQQYAKAVGKYSEAIKVFPHDAVFYANRALCQLKLNNLYSAEADCTTAINLDQFYVKAYHRRATTRIELKRYQDAQKDIEIILKLEPSNKEAASMLATVQKKIEVTSKQMIISGEKVNEKGSIEKTIGEKLLGKKLPSSKENENSKQNEQNKKLKTSENKNDSIIKVSSNVSKKSQKVIKEDPNLPSWLPKLKNGISIVQPARKAPHRSSQTLKRISIMEIQPNESIFKEIEEGSKEEISNVVTQPKDILKTNVLKTNDVTKSESKTSTAEYCSTNKTKVDKSLSLPLPPKTYVRFITSWRKNTSNDFRYKYLKQIDPKDLPDIFKESLESNTFSEILAILNTEFISNNDKVYDFLSYFGKVKRFRALILFMSEKDVKAIRNLFEYCKTQESKTDKEIKQLYSVYEL